MEIETTAGHRYRLSAVGTGSTPAQAAGNAVSGQSYVYADYVLDNPLDKPVLLDLYTADVFIKRDLLPEDARGRCMWHNGVPEDMCTPPAKPQVRSQLAGDPASSGASGDRYMAPDASYVIRVSVDVPLQRALQPGDLRLFIWKPTYMADALAKEVPFPQ